MLARIDVLNYTCKSRLQDRSNEQELTFPVNFVPYFAWAGAEIAVAMICVGIPTLRPLYLKARGITSVHDRSHNTSELPRFTMLKEQPEKGPAAQTLPSPPSSMESGLAKPADVYLPDRRGPEDVIRPVGQRGGVIWVQSEIRISDDEAKRSSFI